MAPSERVETAPPPKTAEVKPPSSLDLKPTEPVPGTVGIPDQAGPPKVALLLPLSGRAAAVGKALRNAAELALFDVASDDFVLAFYDTASSPQTAAAVARTAINEGADMIIGPLFSDSARAVGPVAVAANVPVLSFSNDRSAAGNGVWVLGMLPGEQVERVVRYAATNGYSRIGVLAPSNAYGFEAMQAARDTAAMTGATISRMRSYTPGSSTSLSDTVKSFAASNSGSSGYDAVLVPEGGQAILNLAPLMAYYDIDPNTVKYLGTALWADPSLGREPTLVGGWFAAPDPAGRKPFIDRYRSVHGSAPHGLASLAYDAVGLAAVLARQPEQEKFAIESLTQPSGFNGADGLFRLLADGTNQRGLAILRLTASGFERVDPAPTSFSGAIN
ncbi:penicillin-binding protein activator [Thalassobaculum sp. OXR-137]|uniref:penicillin-binding protein activator n=1 Tax=Thalassobaculum sp. OXR-137 TaxID=3100173 RepID=UPI002AC8F5BA|nr:penicillin-binding protein activator [Thalassobaculum sp. OXR-137]WPZ35539.1 penicillin-binding protein activator [Thalassobaculum sp. OXR-137]